MNDSMTKVLLGSPIRQNPEILKEFLLGVSQLDSSDTLQVGYYFIDDNTEEESSQLLLQFAEKTPHTTLTKAQSPDNTLYLCNENTHLWEESLIWKVADFKNHIIETAIKEKYDYLFLVDSDLVLHPQTLKHLVSLQKDIVSEVFWTRWEPDLPELPQVWMSDQYTLYNCSRGENLDEVEIFQRVQAFIKQLKIPGVYPVGGLGACTLISKNALEASVNFKEIYNVSYVGEDRHFCIRAAALGFKLYADTHYPPYHIYRLSDLERLKQVQERP